MGQKPAVIKMKEGKLTGQHLLQLQMVTGREQLTSLTSNSLREVQVRVTASQRTPNAGN